jgi:hypothetical protein
LRAIPPRSAPLGIVGALTRAILEFDRRIGLIIGSTGVTRSSNHPFIILRCGRCCKR